LEQTGRRNARLDPALASRSSAFPLHLHANFSERVVQSNDVFICYRTNPHLDMGERGAEAAAAIREMLGGV
jgi:microcystin degradation protein MlrC